jgi:hypothetical protein
MFLHFFEIDTIVGFDENCCRKINTCDYISNVFTACQTNDYENNEIFTGWETEEADNETFYLVFKTKDNKKWYFGLHNDYGTPIIEMNVSKTYAIKFIYNNEKTKIISSNGFGSISFNSRSYLSFYKTNTDDNDKLFCVCLTESINNHYVLK